MRVRGEARRQVVRDMVDIVGVSARLASLVGDAAVEVPSR